MTIGTGHSSGITTTTVATVQDSTGNPSQLYVLLDTGCSSSILSDKYLKTVKNIKKSKSHYSTAGGPYKTSKTATLTFKLPEFSTSKDITWQVDMDSGKLEELGYDMIIGRDLLQALKVVIDFEYQVIKWDDVSIPMNRTKLSKNVKKELNAIFQLATEPKTIQQATERVSRILDASYEKANLVEVVDKHCCHLSKDRRNTILKLLLQFEDLFDGTLGEFHTNPVHLDLKVGAVPKHHKPFPVAKIHEVTLKKELER